MSILAAIVLIGAASATEPLVPGVMNCPSEIRFFAKGEAADDGPTRGPEVLVFARLVHLRGGGVVVFMRAQAEGKVITCVSATAVKVTSEGSNGERGTDGWWSGDECPRQRGWGYTSPSESRAWAGDGGQGGDGGNVALYADSVRAASAVTLASVGGTGGVGGRTNWGGLFCNGVPTRGEDGTPGKAGSTTSKIAESFDSESIFAGSPEWVVIKMAMSDP